MTINNKLKKIDVSKYNILMKTTGYMLSKPNIVVIEPTNSCNLSCIKCSRHYQDVAKQRKKGFITISQVKEILKKLPKSVEYIGLNGFGEPLLHPKFTEILEVIKKYNPDWKLGFHTNGLLLNDKIIKTCLAANIVDLEISLDAINQKTYEKLHAKNASFEKVIKNIKKLIKEKNKQKPSMRIGMAYVMQYENKGQLADFLRLAHGLGVDFIGPIVPINPYFGYDMSRWKNPKKDMEQDIKQAKKVQKELKLNVQFPNLERGKKGSANIDTRPTVACAFPFDLYPIITWDGYVMPCVWIQDIRYNMGNILKKDFKEIWNGKRIKKLRKQFANNKLLKICEMCKPGNFDY